MPDSVNNRFVAIPLKQTSQYFTMEATVNHGKRLTLMVDTGDNSSISLNSEDWQEVFGDDNTNVIVATLADAANQIAQSKTGVIQDLEIGNLNYTNLHATLILNPAKPSHVGLGYFRRHNAIFDFANRMLYVEPAQTFSMPDKEDMSGLHLLRDDDATVVYSVDENSPAYAEGIRPKDVIESVNGKNASSLTMKAIRFILQTREGDKITLQARRGDALLIFDFALKKMI